MNKISNTWELAKVSWNVLRSDTELLWLPVMAALTTIFVSAILVVPIILMNGMNAVSRGMTGEKYIGLFLFYFCNYFVVIFFNTALIWAATERLKGATPSVGDALGFAMSNIGRIGQWALVAATVGMILRMIEERVGWLGKIIVRLLGAAWALATYFVVPILIFEKVGPFEAIKESAELFRKTWGERLVSSVSFGLLFFLLAIPAFAVPALALMLGTTAFLVALGLAVIYLLVLATVNAALNGIFTAALYQYAHSGQAIGPFTAQMLSSAWRPK